MYMCVYVHVCCHFSLVPLFVILWIPPGSAGHGIHQARILAWVAMPSSGDPLDLGIKPLSLALQVDSSQLSYWGSPYMYVCMYVWVCVCVCKIHLFAMNYKNTRAGKWLVCITPFLREHLFNTNIAASGIFHH